MRSLSRLLTALACLAISRGQAVEQNYWKVDGQALQFTSPELALRAELPRGWLSLKVKGQELLRPGEAHGAIVFRKADGTFIGKFSDVSNVSHDALQGRNGAVADGLYLAKITTGWTLPAFQIYAGFNDPANHDLVLFLGDEVLAVRLVPPGAAASAGRQNFRHGDKPGGAKGNGAVIVHKTGVALRLNHELWAGICKAPDGQERLAVAIPCKGLAANNIDCLYDTHNASDNLLVFPEFDVASPTMGQSDPGYKPQSNGWWSLYEKDAKLDYTFTFGWLGATPFQGKAVVEARHALGKPHFRIEAVPEKVAEKDGVVQYRAVLHPQFTMPGVSEVNVHLLDAEDVVLYTNRLRILYDWPAYQAGYNAPPGLKAFWDRTLAELRQTPLDAKVEGQLFKDDPAWEFYHVSFNGWQGKRVHACLYVPKAPAKPRPAIVTAHPGTLGFGANHRPDGVFGSQVKCDPRFVTIVPLIRGFAPDAKDVPFNQPWWGPLDTRDDYAARSWFCALVRAVDYLATRPELVDIKRVAASGGSQGGALALVTAALDPRIAVCLSDCPANCMHHDAVRCYPTFGPTMGQVPAGQTLDEMLRTLSYYDPAHLAPWIKCPTVLSVNVGDLTVHSMGGLGVYKNLSGLSDDRKWFMPGSNGNAHGGSYAGGQKFKELLDRLAAGQ